MSNTTCNILMKMSISMNDKSPQSQSKRQTVALLLSTVGLLAIMTAAFLPLVHISNASMRYVYAAGALVLLAGRIIAPKVKDAPLRLRRLLHVEIWTALIFVAGAVFLFIPSAGPRDWLAFTLAGGFLTLYTSIMIPRQKLK